MICDFVDRSLLDDPEMCNRSDILDGVANVLYSAGEQSKDPGAGGTVGHYHGIDVLSPRSLVDRFSQAISHELLMRDISLRQRGQVEIGKRGCSSVFAPLLGAFDTLIERCRRLVGTACLQLIKVCALRTAFLVGTTARHFVDR